MNDEPPERWRDVCALEDIWPDTGVSVLIGEAQIAIFRIGEDRLFALDNRDPFSDAFVLSRGIVGDLAGVPHVASPMYKQRFSLVTGECLDQAGVRVAAYPVRARAGRVELVIDAEEEA